ncbi:MAG: HEPN domain-containing protein [Acidobacteria bacterium]|nr:HEPN domain-containing protein [Acidobacteriota bacterium]
MNRAADWLRQAERDLAAAENAAGAGYHEWAAFGAQQSAEKAVKALVESRHGSARGHSILSILSQCALEVPEPVVEAARELDQVYVTARYPNGFAAGAPADYFSARTSERLLANARSIVDFCRSAVP